MNVESPDFSTFKNKHRICSIQHMNRNELVSIHSIPAEKRLFKSNETEVEGFYENSCIFGWAINGNPLVSIETIPRNTKNFFSFYGGGAEALVKMMIDAGINETIERLVIGREHDNKTVDFTDYSNICSLLAATSFPALQSLHLGVDELRANESMLWGNLGDITGVLKSMPNLQELYLYGNFQLTAPVVLEQLKVLRVSTYWLYYDIPQNIADDTLQHLLSSVYAELETVSIDLRSLETDEEDLITYRFNPQFLQKNKHRLHKFFLRGRFVPGTKIEIQEALTGSNIILNLDDLEETD